MSNPFDPVADPREYDYYERSQAIDDASQLLDGDAPDRTGVGAATTAVDIRLPAEFWGSRPFLKQVQAAAWACRAHPDAVLGAVLARAASMVPYGLKFNSGADGDLARGSTNLFCCLLAPSGIGKSRAADAAEQLLTVPSHLSDGDGAADFERYRCGVGIGSGEGLIEAFMGMGTRHVPGKNGQPVEEKYRTQTRHNAFFYVDEGQSLNKLLNERKGSTLGPTIRSAWNGTSLGQNNASAETTRHLAGGSYSLGMVVGYQPGTAADLLRDSGPGTPQRFLWFGAQDRQMRRELMPWPGRIDLPQWRHLGTIEFDHLIKMELLDYDVDKHHGTVVVDPLDSHEPLMWCKLAALLALIDDRYEVDLDDWRLAKIVYETSSQLRCALEAELAQKVEAEKQARREDLAADDMARRQANHDVVRVARRIARKAKDDNDVHWPEWRRNSGRDKKHADAALSYAEAQGWVIPFGDGLIRSGRYGE